MLAVKKVRCRVASNCNLSTSFQENTVSKVVIVIVVLGLIAFYFYRTSASSASPEKVAENKQAGLDFLEANKAEEGVVTLPSGLQYKVLQEGTGEVHPTATDRVKVHYEGPPMNHVLRSTRWKCWSPVSS